MSGEKNEKLENKIRRFLAEDKYKKIIIIAGFVAIALIFLSNFFEGGGTPQQDTQTVITGSQSIAQYKQETEQLLADMIASIEGAGTTKILVTVDSSEEYVYLANEKESVNQSDDSNEDSNKSGQSSDTEKDYITVRLSDGTEQAIVLKEIQPKIRGVLVVCDGGGDILVQQRVLEAVTKALDISTAQVCVTKLSN